MSSGRDGLLSESKGDQSELKEEVEYGVHVCA
jgi:hypothetical protein